MTTINETQFSSIPNQLEIENRPELRVFPNKLSI